MCLLTNPVWVIKTRLQLQRGAGWHARPGTAAPAATRRYRGVVHAAREIAREEGLKGFYRGIWPSLLLVWPPARLQANMKVTKSRMGCYSWRRACSGCAKTRFGVMRLATLPARC